MSDRDIRQILNEIIEDFDAGRLRMVRTRLPTVRNVVGSALVAVALGLGGAACDGRGVGTATDAGVQRDVAVQVDGGMDLLYMAPMVDAGPMPEYAEPFQDGGIMPAYGEPFYDDGGVYEYMAPPIDAGDVPAYMAPGWDASADPEADGGFNTAYGVPPVPPED
jgi:hypothetical protein